MLKPFPAGYAAYQIIWYIYQGIGKKWKTWSTTIGVTGADEDAQMVKVENICKHIETNYTKCKIAAIKKYMGRHIEDSVSTPGQITDNEKYAKVSVYESISKKSVRLFIPCLKVEWDNAAEEDMEALIQANGAVLIPMPGNTIDVPVALDTVANLTSSSSEYEQDYEEKTEAEAGTVANETFMVTSGTP